MLILLLAPFVASADVGLWDRGLWGPPPSLSRTSKTAAPVVPLFDLNVDAVGSGPSNLSSSLTANSVAMTLALDCDLRSAASSFACATGGTFTDTGSGTAMATGDPTPFTEAGARGAHNVGNAARQYNGASSSVADITTEDIAVEWVARLNTSGTTAYLAGKRQNSGSDPGWWISSGTADFTLTIATAAGVSAAPTSTGLTAGAWYHCIGFIDRSEASANGAIVYCNGIAGTGVNASAASASITSTSVPMLLFLGEGAAGVKYQDPLALLRVWKCAACFAGGATNPTQWAAIAAARFAQVAGVNAVAAGQAYPSAMTRATTAALDVDRDGDGKRRLFTVGNGWMRTARRGSRSGYLPEAASTNLALQSAAFDNASWTKVNVTATADSTQSPDGTTSADSMAQVASAGAVAHCFTQAPTLTASRYAISVYAAPSTRTWVYLNDATIANGASWFDLSACVAGATDNTDIVAAHGTKQANVNSVEAKHWKTDNGQDYCRVTETFIATAAAHTLQICAASADNTTTYDGGAGTATQIIAWGAQAEASNWASTPIATTSATVTRNADALVYSSTSNIAAAQGSFVVSMVGQSTGTLGGSGVTLIGSDTTDTVTCDLASNAGVESTNMIVVTASVTQANIAGPAVSLDNDSAHTVRCTWQQDAAIVYRDGVQEATKGATMSPPTSLARIAVGNRSSAIGLGRMITRARIYATPIAGTVGTP